MRDIFVINLFDMGHRVAASEICKVESWKCNFTDATVARARRDSFQETEERRAPRDVLRDGESRAN